VKESKDDIKGIIPQQMNQWYHQFLTSISTIRRKMAREDT